MSGGNGIAPAGGSGGRDPRADAQERRLPSGLTAHQESALARRALRARMAESKAGAKAAVGLKRCVEILNEHLEGDGVSPTEARRTADTFMALSKRAQEADPGATAPEPGDTPEIHIHLAPEALDAAIGHLSDARKGGRLHDGNGRSS